MSKIVRPDNPVFLFFEKVFNMMLGNLLFLLCSLPVVTFGASLAGLIQVAQDQVYSDEYPVIKRFFAAFRDNFAQATAAWLLLAVFLLGMGCNVLLIAAYLQGWVAQMMKIFVGVLTALVVCIASYFFPLMVRYENRFRQHLNNSLILTVVKLPRTIAMAFLNTLFFWVPFFSFRMFLATLVFWLVLGFAFIAYSDTRILAPVFKQMEEDKVDLFK